jgi:hypothetical protein
VDVVVVTGDAAVTASVVAREVGLHVVPSQKPNTWRIVLPIRRHSPQRFSRSAQVQPMPQGLSARQLSWNCGDPTASPRGRARALPHRNVRGVMDG